MENSADGCYALRSQSPPNIGDGVIALTFSSATASDSDAPVATTSIHDRDAGDPSASVEHAMTLISGESILEGDQGVIHLQIQQHGHDDGEMEDAGNGDGKYYALY